MVTGSLIRTINEKDNNSKNILTLNDREITFLKYVCTELTYKEIADKMFLSPRTIDGYRDDLFQKLNVKTRVGLVMFALKNGIAVLWYLLSLQYNMAYTFSCNRYSYWKIPNVKTLFPYL